MKVQGFLTSIIFIFLPCITTLHAQTQEVVIDKVVAVVGQHIVKMSDIENSYKQVRLQQGYVNPKENRCMILENIMLNKLLVHKGEVDSVEITDDEVEQRVEQYLKMYLRQYGSKEAIQQTTGYTYDELHDVYFDLIKENLLAQTVQYNLTQNVKITPREVTDYFNKIPKDSIPTIEEEYELAEIAIQPQVSEAERERVKFQLAELRERIIKGESFAMLATLYSEDPGSAKKGGELGFFARGDMVSEFEAAAFALKPGEVSPIIETNYGFHIIQLIERRGSTINVRHILLTPKVSGEDLLQARIKLDSIALEIRQGNQTFAEAAKRYSDAATRESGGVLTNPNSGNRRFTLAEASAAFTGIAFQSMNEGDVSNATIYKTDDNKDAYHIITITKRVKSHTANLKDDYDNIYNAALNQAKENKVFEWASRQIKNTYIRIDEDYQDCHFRLNWQKK